MVFTKEPKMNPSTSIQTGSRVFHPDHLEYGFGIVRLIDDNLLDEQRTFQVAFDWIPGLTSMPESVIRLASAIQSGAIIEAHEWGSAEDFQRRMATALAMAENSRTGVFIRSFTTPLPHQAFLLEKIVAHRRFGHVIADDVGMGKTIEAGLIIATLRQQDPRARILVLCPAGVVLQWQDEMSEHFGLEFSVAGRDFKADHAQSWKSHNLILGSLDTLKQDRLREMLKQIPGFDLVVCDEAHRLTAKREFFNNELIRTQNYRFVEWLIQERIVQWEEKSDGTPRSPRLLMLTATPHQGDDLRFAYLLQLARPDQVEAETAAVPSGMLSDVSVLEECITRTAKRRAVDWAGNSIFKGHESRTMDVSITDDEREVLEALTRYVLVEMQFAAQGRGDQLVRALAMHTFQKIAASSWAALESALQNRLFGSGNAEDEFEESASLGQEFAFSGDSREQAALTNLLTRIRALTANSKWNSFSELVTPGNGFRDEGDRILIFTQYRRTQEWLAEKLTELGEKIAVIHGGLSLDERKRQRAYFESSGTMMISTEAGSEGANLHRKCHLEINYDLPWNPMRLLQRIGRLDRYGQKHIVRVANLRAPLSWDSQISAKIAVKLDAVQASMGQVADEDYRAMILGEVHEAINVTQVMQQADWGKNAHAVDSAVDEAVQRLLSRRSALDQLFRESMGMPEDYGGPAPALTPEDFRQAFTWAAAGQGTMLRETRTSDKRFLRGVYHFTLPEAFRGGLRASRECYLVFDRERFAEVRNETLGRARGQEITPSLAGFGDSVTDWFFRSGLQAGQSRSIFTLRRPSGHHDQSAWWVAFAARWKQSAGWSGPDAILAFALRSDGSVIQPITTTEIFSTLRVVEAAAPALAYLPSIEAAQSVCRSELRAVLPQGVDTRHLALFPIAVVQWNA